MRRSHRCNLPECVHRPWGIREADPNGGGGGVGGTYANLRLARETSRNPFSLPRIELTRRLPPALFLSSARGTLVIPNSLMALDQLSRRPFAQIPLTLPDIRQPTKTPCCSATYDIFATIFTNIRGVRNPERKINKSVERPTISFDLFRHIDRLFLPLSDSLSKTPYQHSSTSFNT